MTDRQPLLTTAGDGHEERAVSEVLAFVLVFGVILTSVALLSGFGFQAISDVQELEQTNNAERAMISLADNFNDVLRYDGVDERFGELSQSGGSITTGGADDGTRVDITYDGNSIGEIDNPVELGVFEYETGGDTIVYEGGGVLRSADSGSAMVKQPRIRHNEASNTAVISLTEVNATSRSLQSSDGGTGIRMTVQDRQKERIDRDSVDELTLNFDTEETGHTRAWYQAAVRGGWDDVTEGGNEVTINADVERVVIHIVSVDVELESGS